MDLIDGIDREYTPSLWSKRFINRKLVISHHISHIESESERAIRNIPHCLNIPYGDTERQRIDIFGTDLLTNSPIMVFIHGGFWHELSRQQSRYIVQPLYAINFKTIIVGYDLCPNVTLNHIVQQINAAIIFIIKYATKLGCRGIYLLGHSAGAHLAAEVLCNKSIFEHMKVVDNLLKGVFLISGIYDLTDLLRTAENVYLDLSQEHAKMMSPYFKSFDHLHHSDLRIYVIVAENDSRTFRKQSENFYKHLSKFLKFTVFETYEKMDHFDIMEILSCKNNYLISILDNIFV